LIFLDSRVRGNDKKGSFLTFYEFINIDKAAKVAITFSLFFFASFAGVPAASLRETFLVPRLGFNKGGISVAL